MGHALPGRILEHELLQCLRDAILVIGRCNVVCDVQHLRASTANELPLLIVILQARDRWSSCGDVAMWHWSFARMY